MQATTRSFKIQYTFAVSLKKQLTVDFIGKHANLKYPVTQEYTVIYFLSALWGSLL